MLKLCVNLIGYTYIINKEDFRSGTGASYINISKDHSHLRYVYNNTQEEPKYQSDNKSTTSAYGPTEEEMDKSDNYDIPNDHDFSDTAD